MYVCMYVCMYVYTNKTISKPSNQTYTRTLNRTGLVLAHDSSRVKTKGGVWTPAVCLGEALIDRLVATGSSFQVYED